MGYVKKQKAGRDESEEEEGMERVIEIRVCVTSVAACLLTASGDMSPVVEILTLIMCVSVVLSPTGPL